VLTTLERTLGLAPQARSNAEMPDAPAAARVQPAPSSPPAPVHPASSNRGFVGGAAPGGTSDERLTTTLADWLLAEAGFTGGVKA
jgi:hypothetical protein